MAMSHFVGSVSHLIEDRPAIRPKPGQGPKQSAEHKGQKAQALNGSSLWVLSLLRDFFREYVNEQEHTNGDDGRHYKDDPGEYVGYFVERLTLEDRCLGVSRPKDRRHQDRQQGMESWL
jgi:hypothetical protein